MRVKLCAWCPYKPQDLTDHYDPKATLHACAPCDKEEVVVTCHYPLEDHRGRRRSTVPAAAEIAC
jgi:hypothetical protein